ncbi:hypothetical protein CEXT_73311 [Caerostris extrusa]|uniref:Uncharacterized protein n=1 Tax=Caerostris extrusa TaxID=172846 RepID=A0AAV4XI20_CAEEX|nr:hypothetical protein CEXT_73311 [Caerostris extrusa]
MVPNHLIIRGERIAYESNTNHSYQRRKDCLQEKRVPSHLTREERIAYKKVPNHLTRDESIVYIKVPNHLTKDERIAYKKGYPTILPQTKELPTKKVPNHLIIRGERIAYKEVARDSKHARKVKGSCPTAGRNPKPVAPEHVGCATGLPLRVLHRKMLPAFTDSLTDFT